MTTTSQKAEELNGDTYWSWAILTGVIVFVGVWIYVIAEWVFLLGIMFGWIPALIAASIAGLLWPLIALAIVGLILLLIFSA
jgi:hypothetical protein